MANLPPLENPTNLPVPLDRSPRSKALTTAERIRHTEPVPGSTDNDADSWRSHLADGLTANQEAIRQALARLDTLGNFIDEDGFAVVTADQAEAGYAYQARDGALPANQSLTLVPGNQDTAIGSVPSSGIVLYMRVPAGVDPESVRIDHRRGTSLVASYPRAADAWERFTALTGRSPHYDYYRLVDDALGSVISISGVQANDTFVMRVHGHDSSAPPVETLEVIPDDVDALPDVDDHPDTKLILWRGQFYRRKSVLGGQYSFSFRSGRYRHTDGTNTYGVGIGFVGQFIVNPDSNFDDFAYSQGLGADLYIRQDAYRAAKGSAEAQGDEITVNLTTREDTPRTGSVTLSYGGALPLTGADGHARLHFIGAGNPGVLDADSVGHDIEATLQRSGSDFMLAGSTGTPHIAWVVEDLTQVQLNGQAIRELQDRLSQEEHHSEALRTEVQTLEHKTSRIELERETSPWAATENNADGLRLGKAFFRPTVLDSVNALNGLNWNVSTVATTLTINAAEYDHNLIGFIASNNSTWRNVRVVIRDRAGAIVATYSPQNGRSAPADLAQPPINVPAALGDYTVRYLTNSDGSPAFVPTIGFDYTITVEERTDTDAPVWGGDISEDLRERVAANETQIASVNQQLRNDISNPIFRDILEIDDNSDWDGSTERFRVFSHTIADVQDGDFVEIDWLNLNTTIDISQHFAIHGSTETQGRFLFHGRDLVQRTSARPNSVAGGSTSRDNGFIGSSSGVVRRLQGQNLVLDPENAVMWWFLYRVGTTVHLDAVTSVVNNPQGTGKMPEGFYLRFRTWRASARVQSTRLLPDRPDAVADRRGLVPKFDAEGNMGYDQAIGPFELLAFRSRITGAWTLGAPTGEITLTDLGQSGTTLRINARSAMASKSAGLIVTVERASAEISRVFLPWALFRTGSSTYVTGGGHGTQGIPMGFWSAADNAYLVGSCDWDFDNNRFELDISGPNTDTNSILRVHLAR